MSASASQPAPRRARAAGTDPSIATRSRTHEHEANRKAREILASDRAALEALLDAEGFESLDRSAATRMAFLGKAKRESRQRDVRDNLVSASRGLAESLRDLLGEDRVWSALAAADVGGLTLVDQARLLEVTSDGVVTMLAYLGHGAGPPSADLLAAQVRGALGQLMNGAAPTDAVRTAIDARAALAELSSRLEVLAADEERLPLPAPGQPLAPRLVRALRRARRASLGAVLLAGVAAASGTLVATGQLDQAAAAATAEAVATAVTAASGALVARAGASADTAEPADSVSIVAARLVLHDGLLLARNASADEQVSALVRRAAVRLLEVLPNAEDDRSRWLDWLGRLEEALSLGAPEDTWQALDDDVDTLFERHQERTQHE